MLGFCASLLLIILIVEFYSFRKQGKDALSKADQCIGLYKSTGNVEMLKEARIQLEIAIEKAIERA